LGGGRLSGVSLYIVQRNSELTGGNPETDDDDNANGYRKQRNAKAKDERIQMEICTMGKGMKL